MIRKHIFIRKDQETKILRYCTNKRIKKGKIVKLSEVIRDAIDLFFK